ncbi:hypothetical protein B0H11DRAFT_1947180 [Mycena galericulata]|nr:hypothetical protein B0H11DRAFT_1947180 [Mycena galericulata]
MHRLARLVKRGPTTFATRRIVPIQAPRLRRYTSQKPTLESLYAEYLYAESLESNDKSPHAPPPVSFEVFKQALEDSDSQDGYSPSTDLESGSVAPPRPPLPEKYSEMLSAIEAMRASDPNFSETLENMSDVIRDNLQDSTDDSVFEERLQKLDVENSSEWEVGWRVAQLVHSATNKWDLERIENQLATYDGPLSRLNVHVEWYLAHPEEIELREQEASQKNLEESPELVEEEDEADAHDNNSYYYQDTPVDELVAHLRDRDVQYAIRHRMDRQDREDLFRLLDSIVTPVFKEDMTILNNIAAIFSKYEDVHLEFTTEPRLPRIRRLAVFKRLLPAPEDEGPSQVEEDAEIASIVAETKRELEIVEAAKLANRQPWPNLMTRDPLLDSREVLELPPTKDNPFHNRVIIRNHHSIFTEALDADGFDFKNHEPTKTEDDEDGNQNLPIDSAVLSRLRVTQVVHGFARQQTPKGKKDRFVAVLIVGDGNGMVGIGFGKHKERNTAHSKALSDAIRNMDWVERFENRTIWTEVRTKHGATVVILRPRPVGFGLRCNPYIHRLLTAAGIKDISAKVWGSRNRIGVLKATLRLLHAGHAPLGMGDGVGGPGRKSYKGTGLRNKIQVERALGRRLIDLRV